MRKRTSKIWVDMGDDEFKELINNSSTYKEVLGTFGLENKGNNNKTLKDRISLLDIDISHFKDPKLNLISRDVVPLESVMVIGSSMNRTNIKRRLLNEGIIENICSVCGLDGYWNDKDLIMILDHINGVSNDNRKENLRMVCPNCNSQLDTHCGKNKKVIHICDLCGNEKRTKNSSMCNKCRAKNSRKVIDRPSKENLIKELSNSSYVKMGTKYGVSDKTIRNWIVR